MTTVFISPGAGPVSGGKAIGGNTLRQATKNMRAFVRDLDLGRGKVGFHLWPGNEKRQGGRYMFTLNLGRRKCKVEMPGLSLDRVRYRRNTSDNPWRFPRLYVDGSSWLWAFAVPSARDALTGNEE